MNANEYRLVPTEFGPDTRFEVKPIPPAPFRATQETGLDQLKRRLLQQRLGEAADPAVNGYLRRAANEAAALAWVTPYPLLVFPTLFEEKTRAALRQAERQEMIRQRSLVLLAA